MAQLQSSIDPTGSMTQEELNTQDIKTLMGELNRGVDATGIARRAILASQIRVLSYNAAPIKAHAGATLAAGAFSSVVINFQNNGQTSNTVGQTYLPIWYMDLFIDPPDTSSVDNMYANSVANIYPDGSSVTGNMAKVNFSWYLRNSTPGTDSDLVSYVIMINNQDASPHAYWLSTQLLLPADGNLNEGGVASFLQ